MGRSRTLCRMRHRRGLVVLTAGAVVAFRRASLAGAVIFVALLGDLYFRSHWPLARPDIMVSVCVMGMLVSAAWAIERGGRVPWFLTGFLACSAVTTHQIATAM